MRIPILLILACSLAAGACSHPRRRSGTNSALADSNKEEKAGLSVYARRAICIELSNAERFARRIAEETYPKTSQESVTPNRELARKRRALTRAILSVPRQEIAEKYGITDAMIDAIQKEGSLKLWGVYPRRPDDFDPRWTIPANLPIA